MASFAIMNNTPFHFIAAGLVLAVFLGATFVQASDTKRLLNNIMKGLFVLVFLTGVYVWFLVPFSLPLLIKSVGGLFLMYTMVRIVDEPTSAVWWGLFVVTAAVGLALAFFFI